MYYYNDLFPFHFLGPVLMLLFWILVILWGARILSRGVHPFARDDSSLKIIKERYARGEISKEHFESMKRDVLFPKESHHVYHEESSMRILKERYARGEISKEHFESMKKDL